MVRAHELPLPDWSYQYCTQLPSICTPTSAFSHMNMPVGGLDG